MVEPSVKKRKQVYEGKAKVLYATDHEDLLVQEFKDDATAFNGKKKGKIKNKGVINSQIAAHLFTYLESYHIPTHFIRTYSDNGMVVRSLEMIPLEVVMRNLATGSYVKRHKKVKEGDELQPPVLEYFLKDDEKGDPLIDERDILSQGILMGQELEQIERYTRKVNAVLKDFFLRRNLLLVDFKLEFGFNKNRKIVLADEITPDTCRLWDVESGEKMDKDRFRQDLGKVEEAYEEVRKRVFKS